MLKTRLTDKFDLSYPIISAPMAHTSGGVLAASVSTAGGLGTFGGVHPHSYPIRPDYIETQLNTIRRQTDRPFGVGFINHLIEHYPDNFDMVLDEGVPVVILSFSDPRPWLGRIKESGATAICQVQTMDAAEVAVAEGADIIAVQGNEAGGHTGKKNLLPFLSQTLDKFPDIPIIAAGGIASGRSFAAVLAAGADGALIGTAFMTVTEATEIDVLLRDKILESDGQDTVQSSVFDILGVHAFNNPKWPKGIAIRTFRNKFLEKWHGREAEMEAQLDELTELYRIECEGGNLDVTPLTFGESAGFVNRIQTSAKFMETLCKDTELRLSKAGKLASSEK